MLPTTTDVLIIGAGPTGLTAAIGLARQGRHVTVVDAQPTGATTTRAAVVHARTLELLEPYNVAGRLVARGIHASRFTIRDRDKVLLPVSFDGLPTAYPYTLMISQEVTESVLLERLTELGGQVLRPYTVTGLTQDGAGVTVRFATGETVLASYVVGADGMHSTVREQAGIGFTGGAYDESFSLADVRLSDGLPNDEVILYFSPAGLVVVAPLPGGVHRIVATVADAPKVPGVEFVQRLLDARGPKATRAIVHEVVWGSRFHVQHRVADAYRAGRILLAGDAAHVHSPAGGQGMNAGISDGVALAQSLDAVLGGQSPDSLDAYGATRRPAAQQIVSLADRLTRLATVDRRVRPFRNVILRLLATIPAFRHRLAWRLSGLVYR
ncbi:NAD(P)/FAD-dependent oxidoreductase [Planotetraspora phitsanulokensis]|uniref:Pentachlorophenol monooxygenase n=1 Tax=Planotetraspora phitsanulokensis TaxID=575192 RepID=A0A8J3XFE3_9ACTN|nr:FAD-dependent oxidoreductase [Planotetraspora phitsanulokensis]GII39577.1 pentachlorophenol monooxygenase [Planotetraspora phitsanulokensis]